MMALYQSLFSILIQKTRNLRVLEKKKFCPFSFLSSLPMYPEPMTRARRPDTVRVLSTIRML